MIQTTLIGAKAAQTSYYAEAQAERIGLPLTHMVTINFASTRIDPRLAVAAFSKLRRDRFNKWATRPRRGTGSAFAPTYVFAFENVRGSTVYETMEPGDPHNVHVHWAVHVPADRHHDFANNIWAWVEEMTGGITGGSETINITPIWKTLNGYLVKGTTTTLAELYGRGQAAIPQGVIYGRRADTSRNLGPTARRAMDRKLGIQRQMPNRRPASNAVIAAF
jgi:hypothetical protein